MNFNLEELNKLNEDERKIALEILKQYSETGNSDLYKQILYEDYEEIPVTIKEFLHNPRYLGKGLTDEEGRFTLFPYWEKLLEELYPDPLAPAKYNTLALTGSIGIGKSTEAVIIGCYELYRMLCLKNPYIFYGLQPIDLITFAVMNITMDAAKGVAWSKIQSLIQSSEWFMEKGTISKSDIPEWKPPKGIELIYGSQSRHIIGRAVFWAFFDEVSFQPNQDVEKQKLKAQTLINTASARMQSRFMKGEDNPTILVLASSKRTEQSFMETFIENKKKNDSKTTRVVDEPQWVIRTDKDSTRKFKVAIGNKFLSSEIVPLDATEADLKYYRDKGYSLIDVPIGYYENFIDDIDIALTDIAGISTSGVTRYIAGDRVANIIKEDYKNLFVKDVIEVGNAADDDTQYYDFIDLERLDRKLLSMPMYIHLDMSISGDKTGIAGVWITGKKASKEGNLPSKDLSYKLAFSVSVKAPKGHQISFEKNRLFIRWLRSQGFSIRGISSDTFQSADLLQQMSAEGYNTTIISVDRVKDNICLPYQTFKSAIYEQRLQIYDAPLLVEELIGLERNNNGKIDHGPSGINCFTGDTKVSLTDGRQLTFIELLNEKEKGKINYVYSFNKDKGIIEPKEICNVWCSGKDAKIIEVELDNGEKIKCTPEHRFMLRNGEYKEAQQLKENDSLMPLYTKISTKGLKGYRLYYEPLEETWHFEHRRFCKDVLDEKYLVHHKDCNKLNNNPDNLIWMSKGKHQVTHAELQTGAHSKEAELKRSKSTAKFHKDNKDNPEYWTRFYPNSTPEEAYQLHLETVKRRELDELAKQERLDNKKEAHLRNKIKKENQLKKQQEMASYYNIDLTTLKNTELQSLMIKYAHEIDPTYQERVSKAVSENHKKGKYKNSYLALQKCNEDRRKNGRPKEVAEKMLATKAAHGPYIISEESRKKWSENTSKRRWYNNGESNIYINPEEQEIPEGYVHGRIKTWKNHKVKSVKILDFVEDVYDLEVKDNHNFALSAGVFVHNSKDQADAVCGALYNASQHAEEFAFEYGEDLDIAVNVSSQSLDNESIKKQITLDFEQELQRAFENAEQRQYRENLVKKDEDMFMDFGRGKAKPLSSYYLSQGIIL